MKQNASPFPETRYAVKAVLIDLDGTLIHSAPEIARAANIMLPAMQLPALPSQTVQSFIGEGALTLIKRTLNAALSNPVDEKLDEAIVEAAKVHFFKAYTSLAVESKPYPNAESGLKAFQALNLPIACVTNKPSQFTEPVLKANGLYDYFDMVVSGDTLSKKKPDPDQILHVCKRFKIEPSQAVLIGDSNTDIQAAKNAGCYVFTVPYGYNQGLAIDKTIVDASIDDLKDATNYIQT